MISFSSYMNEWLYGNNGYYRAAMIGKNGDFYTSVSVSKFFGGSIAQYIVKLLEQEKLSLPLKIIEIGADKAHLIGDVAEFLSSISIGVIEECEFATIEPLSELAKMQKEAFLYRVGHQLKIYEKIQDLILNKNESVFVFSNEVFDSFVCEVINESKMIYIDNHKVLWRDISPQIKHLAKQYEIIKGEIPVKLEEFVFSLVNVLNKSKKWEFLSFDYGYWEARNDINLRTYQKHQVENFLEISDRLENFYQKSDITYDVNFSLLDRIFTKNGAKKIFYTSQAKAMIEMGILELLEKFSENVDYSIYLREVGKIKPLISPMGLGERFQCISFGG
ncbi:SAM-dependent methyltransferase [Helicobacter cappadocius]|uniref:SAM-dependent methyltransferase n=1 Tax=Helicobacter cappadocius TaxID=3063998 RepID=A0AA90PR38_9HELI|nr:MULTISPECIES: SAM-dependent methyltransferase [unclassified Helicobacter]MDO7252734.1 SAM-dependent methyltransferase [Helicobacter sp. faydin-H75]MDP2538602.1 SAM-dependent methyltransferase [Helicobacter sp. faydin-H76]